jgi:uncharacterized protein YdhG (YjbR/CyaY superfamily)
MAAAMRAFRKELEGHETTRNFLKIPYDEPVPEALVCKMAKYCLRAVKEREDDSFW